MTTPQERLKRAADQAAVIAETVRQEAIQNTPLAVVEEARRSRARRLMRSEVQSLADFATYIADQLIETQRPDIVVGSRQRLWLPLFGADPFNYIDGMGWVMYESSATSVSNESPYHRPTTSSSGGALLTDGRIVEYVGSRPAGAVLRITDLRTGNVPRHWAEARVARQASGDIAAVAQGLELDAEKIVPPELMMQYLGAQLLETKLLSFARTKRIA